MQTLPLKADRCVEQVVFHFKLVNFFSLSQAYRPSYFATFRFFLNFYSFFRFFASKLVAAAAALRLCVEFRSL